MPSKALLGLALLSHHRCGKLVRLALGAESYVYFLRPQIGPAKMGVVESAQHRSTTTRTARSSSLSGTAPELGSRPHRVRHSSKCKKHTIGVRPPIDPAEARTRKKGTKHHTLTPAFASEQARETAVPVRAATMSAGARLYSTTDSASGSGSQEDAYYWRQVGATLAPINSAEEYMRRFHTTLSSYRASAEAFESFAGEGGSYTVAEWMADAPKSVAAKQWAHNIWRTFVPAGSNMTLAEWLVFDGIRKHGSLEQRVTASFVLFDYSGAGVLRREDIATVMRLASDVAVAGLSESLIQYYSVHSLNSSYYRPPCPVEAIRKE